MPEFEDWLLSEVWYPMLRLNPPYRALRATRTQLIGRQIRNQVAFEIYVHAVNGWMIHASDLCRRLLEALEEIKQNHRREFRRNRWRDIRADPGRINMITDGSLEGFADIRQRIAIDSTNREREDYKKLWDRYFPTSREKGIPSHGDIDNLKERLVESADPSGTIAIPCPLIPKQPTSYQRRGGTFTEPLSHSGLSSARFTS